jgi:hypothetical protein
MTRLLVRDLAPGQNYALKVRANDGETVSEWSRLFPFVTITDAGSPAAPTGATLTVVGSSFVATWNAVTLDGDGNTLKDFDHYQVNFTNGVTPVQYNTKSLRYEFTFDANRSVFGTPSPTVYFKVRAVDQSGNTSSYSAEISATNPAPSAPSGFTATPGPVDTIDLAWTANTETDLMGYNVYMGTTSGFTPGAGNKIWSGAATSKTVTESTHVLKWFKISAFDIFNQESTFSSASATSNNPFGVDGTAPANPTGVVVATGFDATLQRSYLDVSWTANVETDLAGYTVRYGPSSSINFSYVDVTKDAITTRIYVQPGIPYYTAVRAFDRSANMSGFTNASTYPITSTADTTAPSQPSAPTCVANAMQIQVTHDLTKQAGGALEADLDHFEVFASTTTGFTPANANMFGTMAAAVVAVDTFIIPAAAASGTTQTWFVKVKAVDKAGNKSAASNQATSSVGLISTLNIGDAVITNAKINDLAANKITAGTGIINDLTVKSILTLGDASTDGRVQSYDYVTSSGVTGFYFSKTGLIIKTGTIEAAALKIQSGVNLMAGGFADFEYTSTFYPVTWPVSSATSFTAGLTTAQAKFGTTSLSIVNSSLVQRMVYFGQTTTDYNINVEAGRTYIVSAYIWNYGGAAVNAFPFFKQSDTTTVNGGLTSIANTAAWTRYQWLITVSAGIARAELAFDVEANCSLYIDGIQVEQQVGLSTYNIPSVWSPPSLSTIDGGIIKTGSIQSTSTTTVNANVVPLWSINMSGGAVFANTNVRGSLVIGALGGTDLDAGLSYAQSANFSTGTAGWRIASQGNAEFNNITGRGTFTTATSGTRVDVGTYTNTETGTTWGLVNFWGPSGFPSWGSAQVYGDYDVAGTDPNWAGGSVDFGQLVLTSPIYTTHTPARLKLRSNTGGATQAKIVADTITFNGDTFELAGTGAADFHLIAATAFSFQGIGGGRLNIDFNTAGVTTLRAGDPTNTLRQMTVEGDTIDFNVVATGGGVGGLLTLGGANSNLTTASGRMFAPSKNIGVMWTNGGANDVIRIMGNTGGSYKPIWASAFTVSSDARNKTNVKEVDYTEAMAQVDSLSVFDYNEGADTQRGVMAQDVARVLPIAIPEGIDEDFEGGLVIDLYSLTSTTLAATKGNMAEISQLKERVKTLEDTLAGKGK